MCAICHNERVEWGEGKNRKIIPETEKEILAYSRNYILWEEILVTAFLSVCRSHWEYRPLLPPYMHTQSWHGANQCKMNPADFGFRTRDGHLYILSLKMAENNATGIFIYIWVSRWYAWFFRILVNVFPQNSKNIKEYPGILGTSILRFPGLSSPISSVWWCHLFIRFWSGLPGLSDLNSVIWQRFYWSCNSFSCFCLHFLIWHWLGYSILNLLDLQWYPSSTLQTNKI